LSSSREKDWEGGVPQEPQLIPRPRKEKISKIKKEKEKGGKGRFSSV
jgi:hypothetical protein